MSQSAAQIQQTKEKIEALNLDIQKRMASFFSETTELDLNTIDASIILLGQMGVIAGALLNIIPPQERSEALLFFMEESAKISGGKMIKVNIGSESPFGSSDNGTVH